MSAAEFYDDNGTLRLGGTLVGGGSTSELHGADDGSNIGGSVVAGDADGTDGGTVSITGGAGDVDSGGSIIVQAGVGGDGDGDIELRYPGVSDSGVSVRSGDVFIQSGDGSGSVQVADGTVNVVGNLCYAWDGAAYVKVGNVVA